MAKTMEYAETPIKTNVKDVAKNVRIKSAEQCSSFRLLWILVNRHKVGLLIAANIGWILNWAVPAWPQIVLSLV